MLDSSRPDKINVKPGLESEHCTYGRFHAFFWLVSQVVSDDEGDTPSSTVAPPSKSSSGDTPAEIDMTDDENPRASFLVFCGLSVSFVCEMDDIEGVSQ